MKVSKHLFANDLCEINIRICEIFRVLPITYLNETSYKQDLLCNTKCSRSSNNKHFKSRNKQKHKKQKSNFIETITETFLAFVLLSIFIFISFFFLISSENKISLCLLHEKSENFEHKQETFAQTTGIQVFYSLFALNTQNVLFCAFLLHFLGLKQNCLC